MRVPDAYPALIARRNVLCSGFQKLTTATLYHRSCLTTLAKIVYVGVAMALHVLLDISNYKYRSRYLLAVATLLLVVCQYLSFPILLNNTPVHTYNDLKVLISAPYR